MVAVPQRKSLEKTSIAGLPRSELITQMDALIRQHADLFFVVDPRRHKIFLETPVRRMRFLYDALLLAHVFKQQLDVVS